MLVEMKRQFVNSNQLSVLDAGYSPESREILHDPELLNLERVAGKKIFKLPDERHPLVLSLGQLKPVPQNILFKMLSLDLPKRVPRETYGMVLQAGALRSLHVDGPNNQSLVVVEGSVGIMAFQNCHQSRHSFEALDVFSNITQKTMFGSSEGTNGLASVVQIDQPGILVMQSGTYYSFVALKTSGIS